MSFGKAQFSHIAWRIQDSLGIFALSWLVLPAGIQILIIGLGTRNAVFHRLSQQLNSEAIAPSFVLNSLNAIIALVLVWLLLKRTKSNWQALGLRRFNVPRAMFYMAAIYVAFFVLVYVAFVVVSMLIPSFNAGQEQVNEFTKAVKGMDLYLSVLSLAVVAPVVEEIVFRGLMFGAMAKRWGVLLAALVSSFIFAFAHLQANVSIYTFVLGLLLCLLYYKLRSIWPGIIFHTINNYLAFIAIAHK